MVRLKPMTPEVWARYRETAVHAYAEDKVRSGAWSEAEALERSDGEFTALLPDGVLTPDHHVRSVVDEGGDLVGALWFGPGSSGAGRTCFIYDFEVFTAYRGRGFGRAALEALEPIARELGYDVIALHVFGDNDVARNLYRSSGYVETDVSMRKTLGSAAG